MDPDPQFRQFSQDPRLARAPQGPLAKVLAFILSAAFLVLAFMFSLVALAVVAVLGVALGGCLWWKTRTLRKQMRAAEDSLRGGETGTGKAAAGGSTIIEGEFVRETSASERLLR